MKTKSKRLLSLALAVVMAVSASMASLSAYAAKADYGEQATEEQFTLMLEDINTILDDVLPTFVSGDSLESIYGILPGLSAIFTSSASGATSATVTFYTDLDSELFGNLAEYTEDGSTVTADVLTSFFAENPIGSVTEDEFIEALNNLIDTVVNKNFVDLFAMLMLGTDETYGVAFGGTGDGSAKRIALALDDICAALGIEQEYSAEIAIVASYNGYAYYQSSGYDVTPLQSYLKNIVAYVVPLLSSLNEDASGTIVNILKAILTDDVLVGELLPALLQLLEDLPALIDQLQLNKFGFDVSSVTSVLETINSYVTYVATIETENGLYLDIAGTINTLIDSYLSGYALELTELDYEALAAADTDADFVKMVFDYIYDNLVGTESNNEILTTLLKYGILESMLSITISDEIKEPILEALTMENDELAYYIITLVADAAGRDMNPSSGSGTGSGSTGSGSTSGSTGSDTSSGSTSGTSTGTTASGTSSSDDDDTTTSTVTSTSIPDTGRYEESVTTASLIVFVCAAAALVVVLAKTRKKVSE